MKKLAVVLAYSGKSRNGKRFDALKQFLQENGIRVKTFVREETDTVFLRVQTRKTAKTIDKIVSQCPLVETSYANA